MNALTSLTVTDATAASQEWLARLDQEGTGFELDLAGVTRLDAAGVQLLLALEQETRRRSIPLRLRNPSPECRRVFLQIGLGEALARLTGPEVNR